MSPRRARANSVVRPSGRRIAKSLTRLGNPRSHRHRLWHPRRRATEEEMMRFGVRGKTEEAHAEAARAIRDASRHALDRAGRHAGQRQVGRRAPARRPPRAALRRCRRGDRARGRQAHHGHLQGPRRGLFPRRRAQGDRAPAARGPAGAGDRRRGVHGGRDAATTSAAPASRSGSRRSCPCSCGACSSATTARCSENDPEARHARADGGALSRSTPRPTSPWKAATCRTRPSSARSSRRWRRARCWRAGEPAARRSQSRRCR